MKCPNCDEVLVMADRQGIEIDYCPKCRGVWLDKGELDKIIERSESPTVKSYDKDVNDNRYDRDYSDNRGHYDKGHPHHKKRGGFLSNMFDFD